MDFAHALLFGEEVGEYFSSKMQDADFLKKPIERSELGKQIREVKLCSNSEEG